MTDTLRLFLVEDDEDYAFLMRKSLERAGHHVTTCRSAADALIVLGHDRFDLALVEQVLQDGDESGLDLLQTMNQRGLATPVIMVTGKGDESLAAQVLRAGALDYIVKDSALTFLTDLPKRVAESVRAHELRQTNRLYVQALESARDGIAVVDRRGSMIHVNGALEGMLRCPRQELIGKTPPLLSGAQPPAESFSDVWLKAVAQSSWQGELAVRRKDDTVLDVSLTISPITDEHAQRTHFVAIFRDISERKLMERQLFQAQKMQSVGTLAGGIAHEFNNLLAGIQGYATLGLREANVPATAHEFLQAIVGLSDRAALLTRQLLAYARKPTLVRQPTNMAWLLRDTANLVRQSLHLDVDLSLPPDANREESFIASTDANLLQQALVNLVLNARDAMAGRSPSPVAIRLIGHVLDSHTQSFPDTVPAGDYIVIDVEDRGAGMAPNILAQAFDPFFTTKEIGQGTGLGLPVAYGIVNAHQGFLTTDTRPGQGTCIRLFLPRLKEKSAPPDNLESPAAQETRACPGKTILVIDDEPAVLDVVKRFLEIAGHRVLAVTTGQQALELLQTEENVDLVVLDRMIPHEEGQANLRSLRARRPDLPILLCTGQVQDDKTWQSIQGQAAELLRKPFRMQDLWDAVNRALRADST